MFKNLTVFIMLLVMTGLVTTANATNVVCNAASWFNESNDYGSAEFSFSLDYEESNGNVKSFNYWNLQCDTFQAINFTSNLIHIECSKPPLSGMEAWGDRLRTIQINRNTGKFDMFSRYSRGEKFTMYEGQCGIAAPKF